jgi:hypothetical protein
MLTGAAPGGGVAAVADVVFDAANGLVPVEPAARFILFPAVPPVLCSGTGEPKANVRSLTEFEPWLADVMWLVFALDPVPCDTGAPPMPMFVMVVVELPIAGIEVVTTGVGLIGIPIAGGLMMTGIGFDIGPMADMPDPMDRRHFPSRLSTESDAFRPALLADTLSRSWCGLIDLILCEMSQRRNEHLQWKSPDLPPLDTK